MMIWIEMSKDETHGGGEWGFSKCIWAPTYKKGKIKSSWPFWKNILNCCFCRIFYSRYRWPQNN
jgi:hypothetical protein